MIKESALLVVPKIRKLVDIQEKGSPVGPAAPGMIVLVFGVAMLGAVVNIIVQTYASIQECHYLDTDVVIVPCTSGSNKARKRSVYSL